MPYPVKKRFYTTIKNIPLSILKSLIRGKGSRINGYLIKYLIITDKPSAFFLIEPEDFRLKNIFRLHYLRKRLSISREVKIFQRRIIVSNKNI
jgi:hypothetical protein